MNTTVRIGLMSLTLVAGFAAFGYQVSNVSARQHWPWDNKVDVDFTVSDAETGKPFFVDIAATYPGVAGDELKAKSLLSEPVVAGNGTYRFVWDVGADAPGLYTTNFNVRVTLTPYAETSPVYMVINLAGGAEASSYPVRYTTQAPDLSDDTCRTTEMWLRRCPACTFTMGDGTTANVDRYPAHTVVLTKPYYIGIFEVTRKQWNLVKGTWPMGDGVDPTKPVGQVTMYDIWGQPTYMAGGTFISALKNKSGLAGLNLPSEAQWEAACRAGSTGAYYWPEITSANIAQWSNTRSHFAIEKVGSYPANPWGLFDMYGNLREVVLDYAPVDNVTKIQEDISAGYFDNSAEHIATYFTDPIGWPGRETASSDTRVHRGCSTADTADKHSSFYRARTGFNDKNDCNGFRVCVTVQ